MRTENRAVLPLVLVHFASSHGVPALCQELLWVLQRE